MALKETIKHMRELLSHIEMDLVKAEGGNKAASQRVRTGTVALEKLAKVYRKESIQSEKGVLAHSSRSKSHASHAAHGSAKSKTTKATEAAKAKAKPKAKSASASSRPLQVKRPTAKLPRR